MSFSPNLFLSNIKAKDGLAKPSRFEVILPIPPQVGQFVGNSTLEKLLNLPNLLLDITDQVTQAISVTGTTSNNPSITRYLALQCESTELPGRSIATQDVKIYGPIFKVPTQTVYNDHSFTFLCTNDFYERKLFDTWLNCINPSDTNNFRYPKADGNNGYMTSIKIIQYDEFIKQIYAVELIDAFPIAVSAQPLSWMEEGFHRLTVQFSYQKYRVLYESNYDLAAAAAALFGTAASRLLPFNRAI
jgi:hypothetical protein